MTSKSLRRHAYDACAAAALLALMAPVAAFAQTQVQTYSFNIPAQDLASALRTFGQQSHQQIIFDGSSLRGTSRAVTGAYTAPDAIKMLLSGTGFSVRVGSHGEYVVERRTNVSEPSPSSDSLPEVVVTAQKREENLKTVPVPVSAISAATLAKNNQVLLRDFYATVPGFEVTPVIGSSQNLSIRGVTTGGQFNPTVGVTIDDVPYGNSSQLYVPEIDPGDLARVEVLRGPQGTLYGADSMGGLLKYVTVQPSTQKFSGAMSAGISGVDHGAEPGYNIRASANIPLTDDLAMRISGFKRRDPGYIDNILTHTHDINEGHVYGGRVAVLWKPTDSFSANLSALYQHTDVGGTAETEKGPGLGDLQQNNIEGSGLSHLTIQAYSATLKDKIGAFNITSLTGYNISQNNDTQDETPGLGAAAKALFGVKGVTLQTPKETKKVTQEVRIAPPSFGRLDTSIGLLYTHEDASDVLRLSASDPASGHVVTQPSQFYFYNPHSTFEEYAVFTDLTYHVTDQFDVQFGGRASHLTVNEETFTKYGVINHPNPTVVAGTQATASPFTYLVTPRYRLSSDVMVYARFASGYRPGGTNTAIGAPLQYNPDQTKNYEVGAKGDFLDRKLSIDASLYYIDWSQIQIQLQTPALQTYTGNGSHAKSEGVELSATLRPVSGMTLGGWVSYDDAVLTQSFGKASPTYGQPGDRLPYTPKVSGNVSLEQRFHLADDITGNIGGDVSYVGDRIGLFESTAVRQNYAAYAKLNLHTGVSYGAWAANLYANNVTNERGVLNGGLGYYIPTAYVYIPPRTVGLNLSTTF